MRLIAVLLAFASFGFLLGTQSAHAVPVAGSFEVWLRGDVGVEEAIGDAAENGDAVLRWLDQSGNSRVFDQANATKQPLYNTTAINSRPALAFNGVNQWLQSAPVPAIAAGSVSIFAVATGNDSSASTKEEAIFAQKYWDGMVLERGTGANSAIEYYSNFGNAPSPYSIAATGVLPNTGYTAKVVGAEKVAGVSASVFVDGTVSATTLTGNVRNASTNGNLYIAHHEYGIESYTAYNGDIAELLVFSRALNGAERVVVDNHLAAKYGIAVANDAYNGTNSYGTDVIGIGRASTGANVTSSLGGLQIDELNSSLDTGEYVLTGHNNATNAVIPENGNTQRWSRVWYVDKTSSNGVDATLSFDFTDAGLPLPVLGPLDAVQLLYSPTDSFNFSVLDVGFTQIGDTFSFALSDADLLDGYYTLAIQSLPEPSSALMLGLGMLGLARSTRRRKSRTPASA